MPTNTTRTPRWAKGMQKLGPGIYEDASRTLHISEEELCEHYGVAYTQENGAIVEEILKAALSQVFGMVPPITKVEEQL
jgi:hypothetical protein